ncbi:hypothetical protein CP533_3959 [Ophiocordyceps camponoti-saundersi (nom. inval.)]|nr:hypothetical protein CP533_3959 [Ophiocordyceps camponoti-saundersi (nom. inval.)]
MPPLPPDPYKILGVAKDAQIPEIRSAHRKLVLKCHPDKVQDPKLKAEKQDEFQQVQQAYELLSDENKRRKYDDQVKLAELCKLYQAKANISTPRSATKEFNIYTAAEPPPSPTTRGRPAPKSYTFRPVWEDEVARGPRIFDQGPPLPPRRESSFFDRPSKREVEREREKDREREKERERRRKQDENRRLEKEAKEQRRAERKLRDKQRDKERRDAEKRPTKPYIEPLDDPSPNKSEKKKSKRYDDGRDRSSGREDEMPAPSAATQRPAAMEWAQSYIDRAKNNGPPTLKRSNTHQPTRNANPPAPPAPTPPPMQGQSSLFGVPGGVKPRRASGDAAAAKQTRDRSYRTSDEEPSGSPPTRHAPQFASGHSPRRELHRSGTAPVDGAYTRPVPGMQRSQSMNGFPETTVPRGRDRSRMHAQIEEESDGEDVVYLAARDRDRKHRGGRRYRSPDEGRRENIAHYYQVDGGRTKLHEAYSRRLEPEMKLPSRYYAGIPVESRPHALSREGSYMTNPTLKVKTSKHYNHNDVQYSNYYRHGHANATYA